MSMRSPAEPKFQTVNPQRSWNLIPGGAETSNYHSPAETIQFLQIPQQVILKPENQTTTSDNSPEEWQTTQTPEPTPQQ